MGGIGGVISLRRSVGGVGAGMEAERPVGDGSLKIGCFASCILGVDLR